MTEHCDPIEEKLDEHIQEHKQDYKENMVCVQEIKTTVALLNQKFDDYLLENKQYRESRQKSEDDWREEMKPITDAWKVLKWLFGGVLALGAFAGAIAAIKKFL